MVSYFMYKHIYFLCVGMFFVVDIIHQSGTVNNKISLDKIVGIFPTKNMCLKRKYSQTVFSCINIFKSTHFSVFLNAIYLVCYISVQQ